MLSFPFPTFPPSDIQSSRHSPPSLPPSSPNPYHTTHSAAKDLRALVESASRGLSIETFARFENELFQRVFALVHSPESQLWEKLGGLEAMDELIDVPSAEAETKVIKFANKLSFSLRYVLHL